MGWCVDQCQNSERWASDHKPGVLLEAAAVGYADQFLISSPIEVPEEPPIEQQIDEESK